MGLNMIKSKEKSVEQTIEEIKALRIKASNELEKLKHKPSHMNWVKIRKSELEQSIAIFDEYLRDKI
jgi:hypothetical protein